MLENITKTCELMWPLQTLRNREMIKFHTWIISTVLKCCLRFMALLFSDHCMIRKMHPICKSNVWLYTFQSVIVGRKLLFYNYQPDSCLRNSLSFRFIKLVCICQLWDKSYVLYSPIYIHCVYSINAAYVEICRCHIYEIQIFKNCIFQNKGEKGNMWDENINHYLLTCCTISRLVANYKE